MELETPERFHRLCLQLTKRHFAAPVAVAVDRADLWDRATTITHLPSEAHGDVIWQSVFSASFGGRPTWMIRAGLDSVARHEVFRGPRYRPARRTRWVVCVPIDPPKSLLSWMSGATDELNVTSEIWGETVLTNLLQHYPDILQSFFSFQRAVRKTFRADNLELLSFSVDPACQWHQPDAKVLHFSRTENVRSPDLVLDVVVRNTGTLETMLTGLTARVRDYAHQFHGIPGEGLLLPAIEYCVSIGHGEPGDYTADFPQLLRVGAGALQRFKIRITETGYAWNGLVGLVLYFGKEAHLEFPWFRVYT